MRNDKVENASVWRLHYTRCTSESNDWGGVREALVSVFSASLGIDPENVTLPLDIRYSGDH